MERCAQSELCSTWNTLLVRLCMYAGIWAMGESSLVFLELRPRGAGVVTAGRQGRVPKVRPAGLPHSSQRLEWATGQRFSSNCVQK